MADQAAALARTTHQLMAGGGTAAGAQDGSMSPGGVGSLGGGPVLMKLSAPVSLEGGGSGGMASLQPRQRAASEPQASAADAAGEQGQLGTRCWACPNVGTHRLAWLCARWRLAQAGTQPPRAVLTTCLQHVRLLALVSTAQVVVPQLPRSASRLASCETSAPCWRA